MVTKLFHIKKDRLMLFIVVITRNTKIQYVGHKESCKAVRAHVKASEAVELRPSSTLPNPLHHINP